MCSFWRTAHFTQTPVKLVANAINCPKTKCIIDIAGGLHTESKNAVRDYQVPSSPFIQHFSDSMRRSTEKDLQITCNTLQAQDTPPATSAPRAKPRRRSSTIEQQQLSGGQSRPSRHGLASLLVIPFSPPTQDPSLLSSPLSPWLPTERCSAEEGPLRLTSQASSGLTVFSRTSQLAIDKLLTQLSLQEAVLRTDSNCRGSSPQLTVPFHTAIFQSRDCLRRKQIMTTDPHGFDGISDAALEHFDLIGHDAAVYCNNSSGNCVDKPGLDDHLVCNLALGEFESAIRSPQSPRLIDMVKAAQGPFSGQAQPILFDHVFPQYSQGNSSLTPSDTPPTSISENQVSLFGYETASAPQSPMTFGSPRSRLQYKDGAIAPSGKLSVDGHLPRLRQPGLLHRASGSCMPIAEQPHGKPWVSSSAHFFSRPNAQNSQEVKLLISD